MRGRVLAVFLLGSAVAQAAEEPWDEYEQALESLARGDTEGARERLAHVSSAHVNHPAAAYASEVSRALEAEHSGHLALSPRLARIAPTPGGTALARAELPFFQTLNGIAFGAGVCLLARCSDVRAGVSSALAGGVLGLTSALLLTKDGISPGAALALDSGAAWGVCNGIAAVNAISQNQSGPDRAWAAFLGLQLAGTATGTWLGLHRELDPGDVAFANFGGIWAGAIYLLVSAAVQANLSDRAFWLSFAAASDAGLLAGAIATRWFHVSRGRAWVLDAGGVLGLLAGLAAVVLVNGSGSVSDGALFGVGTAGAIGGIAAAAVLTREWDLDALLP